MSHLGVIIDLPELETVAIRGDSVNHTIFFASIFAVLVNDSYILFMSALDSWKLHVELRLPIYPNRPR